MDHKFCHGDDVIAFAGTGENLWRGVVDALSRTSSTGNEIYRCIIQTAYRPSFKHHEGSICRVVDYRLRMPTALERLAEQAE